MGSEQRFARKPGVGLLRKLRLACERLQTGQIHGAADDSGGAAEKPLEVGVLGRLDEAEMALRQGELCVLRHEAERRRREGFANQLRMARAGDAVDDDSRHLDAAAVPREPFDERRGGRRLPAGVDDEQHRQAEALGERGGGSGAVVAAVEQSHHALADHDVGAAGGAAVAGGEGLRTHRPWVEIAAGAPGRRGVEGGVDIVRPRLERADAQALGAQAAQEAEGYRSLAAAR